MVPMMDEVASSPDSLLVVGSDKWIVHLFTIDDK